MAGFLLWLWLHGEETLETLAPDCAAFAAVNIGRTSHEISGCCPVFVLILFSGCSGLLSEALPGCSNIAN